MTRAAFLVAILTLGPLAAFSASSTSTSTNSPHPTLNIRDFGAHGDGQTKDTAALQNALTACAKAGGGTVFVPAGNYLIGSVVMAPNTTLKLDSQASLNGSSDVADYPLVQVRWEGEFSPGHRALISAGNAENISIIGTGSIVGPPPPLSRLRNPRGPSLIELTSCTNVLLEGFSTKYQQLWSIHPLFCQNFTARNLTIRSANANGDGIDVDSCRDVLIEHSDMDTGDDAIALKSGRGLAAVRLARPTENVVIRNCKLVSSMFGGLGIGSEMSGGIRNVKVENCTISGRKNSILIKSREGRGGFMEDIACENLVIQNSPNFLSIDLLSRGIQATDPVTDASEKWARVRNLSFKNITFKDVGELVSAKNVSPESPVEGLQLMNFSGDCRKGVTLVNVKNASLSAINVTGFQGELLTTNNVTLTALELWNNHSKPTSTENLK